MSPLGDVIERSIFIMKFERKQIGHLSSFLFCFLVLLSSYIMIRIVFPYMSWKWNVDFLLTKQFIIHLDHYRIAFYTHIFSSLLVLFAGAFLFSSYVLKNFPLMHRNFGKAYIGLILGLSAPSGLIMSFYANGGYWVKFSFLILTPLWWYFTFKGYSSIRNIKIKEHKEWMIRSYALTLSAISLRMYQYLLSHFFYIEPEIQYLLVSWISWVGNLLVAEAYIRIRYKYFRITKTGGAECITTKEIKKLWPVNIIAITFV